MSWMNPDHYEELHENEPLSQRDDLAFSPLTGNDPASAAGVQAFVALDAIVSLWRSRRRAQTPDSSGMRPHTTGLKWDWRSLFDQRRFVRYWQTRRLVGSRRSIPFNATDELLAEVEKHRWIEAHKAGFDIWATGYPRDPEGGALAEWVRLYYDGWYASYSRKHGVVRS